MAVVRVHKTKDYTTMSNYHFKNHEMSLKAKGLLSLMLSLPDDWDYSIEGLTLLVSDGKDSIRAALKELEGHNYLRRTRRTKAGKFDGYEYDIYEKPLSGKPLTENPTTGKPTTEKPLTENPTQLNTNKSNTNKSNTNNRAFRPPAVEDVSEYCLERNNGIDPSEFVDFYASKGWMVGKSKMKDWKAAVRNWERRRTSEKPKQSKVLSLEELEAIENGKRT